MTVDWSKRSPEEIEQDEVEARFRARRADVTAADLAASNAAFSAQLEASHAAAQRVDAALRAFSRAKATKSKPAITAAAAELEAAMKAKREVQR